jgi:hypothetical protein
VVPLDQLPVSTLKFAHTAPAVLNCVKPYAAASFVSTSSHDMGGRQRANWFLVMSQSGEGRVRRRTRGDAEYRIHLTYPIDEIDVARASDWHHKKEAKVCEFRSVGKDV